MRTIKALVLSLLLAGTATAMPPAAGSAPIVERSAGLSFGVAWYPEQWPEARWPADLALMRDAHMNVVRIAEFAWSRIEPADGRFDFGWLDRAIAAADAHGLKVVLGTPTAAPPAWLTDAHPEVLRVNEDGSVEGHGGRRQFSFASPVYRRYARRIAAAMAARYGHNPAVIGWQIDNEIGPFSFDAEAQRQWHSWLGRRYGTVAELNRRWTTEYWSQHYDRFDQVPLHAKGQQNPGLLLDFDHWATDTWTDYVANQVTAIRAAAAPRQFVTTNTMHWNLGFDHFALHRQLDLAAWDNYIPDGRPDWLENAANHDLVRGFKQRNFWVMETQPGRVDWVPVNRTLDPGQMREMAWQAVAHGADALLYWQWRSALGGQEQYHGTLLGADGTPLPLFPEAVTIGAEFARAAPLLAGTSPHARVAMLFSYDNAWAIRLQPHHRDFDPIRELVDWYKPLRSRAQAVDIISTDADLSAYSLVVAPSLNLLTPADARRLTAYVRGGGHLVLGPRTGMKDDANALWPARQPGPLRSLLGAQVDQFYALDAPVPASGALGDATVTIWAELLAPQRPDAAVIERYGEANGWLDGKPAVVARRDGRGSITYVGAWFDAATLDRLAARSLAEAGVMPIVANVPTGVEIATREGPGGRRALILINHNATPASVALPAGARPIVGDIAGGSLAPHGVAVLDWPRSQAGARKR